MSLDKLPGLAEVAMQSGHYAGHKVTMASIGQTQDKPFKYRDLGSAAYISRGRAVVHSMGMHFGGFPGWVAWLFIHIGFLTGWRNRIGALFSWWFAFTRDVRRERGFTIDDMPIRAFSELPKSTFPGNSGPAAAGPAAPSAPATSGAAGAPGATAAPSAPAAPGAPAAPSGPAAPPGAAGAPGAPGAPESGVAGRAESPR